MSVSSDTTMPLVSVIMAVKNGGDLVKEAIDSILIQSLTNFEFIIINDGSTDETLGTLQAYRDPRILVVSQENQGLAKALNKGLMLARGKYIARQDHDDISLPTRLEKQVQYLEQHPRVGLLGTAAQIWSLTGATGRFHDHPSASGVLAFELLFNNPFVHTSWMFPRKIIETVGLYTTDPKREPPEDYEFVSRVVRVYEVANLVERLVIYRELKDSLSSQIRPNQAEQVRTFAARLALISAENLSNASGIALEDRRVQNFGALTHGYFEGLQGRIDFQEIAQLLRLAEKKLTQQYQDPLIAKCLQQQLIRLSYQCYAASDRSFWSKCQYFFFGSGYQYLYLKLKQKWLS